MCAPSNSALDALCRPAMDRFSADGEEGLVVRFGDVDRVNPSVHPVTLRTLAGTVATPMT